MPSAHMPVGIRTHLIAMSSSGSGKQLILGPVARVKLDALFELGDENVAHTLGVVARVPENYFSTDFSVARVGMGSALLTAVLLEDMPPEGNLRQLQAPVWTESFYSSYPDAVDDLEHLAALPEQDVAEMLEGAVLDRDLALRAQRVARHVVSVMPALSARQTLAPPVPMR